MALDEKTVEKIRKLLALGTSSNEHEAALALAKAQELMEANDIALADVENSIKSDDSIAEAAGTVLKRRGKPEDWKVEVAQAIARTSDVWLLQRSVRVEKPNKKYPDWPTISWEKEHYFLGLKRDIEFAGYALSFLLGELERLANEYTRERWAEIWAFADERGLSHQMAESRWVSRGNKHPLASRKYFLEGAASGVSEALQAEKQARREASDATNALVLMKSDAIRDWWYRKHYGKSYEEYQAAAKAQRDAYEATRKGTEVAKPETDAQRRRRLEREERKQERDSNRYWNAYYREQAKRDRTAYEAGLHAGRKVSVRPGVGDGDRSHKVRIGD